MPLTLAQQQGDLLGRAQDRRGRARHRRHAHGGDARTRADHGGLQQAGTRRRDTAQLCDIGLESERHQ